MNLKMEQEGIEMSPKLKIQIKKEDTDINSYPYVKEKIDGEQKCTIKQELTDASDSVGDTKDVNINCLITPEYIDIDSDLDKDYELTMSDIERELDEDERKEINDFEQTLDNLHIYPCKMCEQVFATFAEVKEHRRIHYIEKRTCNICQVVCKTVGKLAVHVNSHLGLKPCKCDQCEKAYSSSTQLKIHKRIHNNEKPYKCEQCDKQFRYMGTLKSHMLIAHTNIMKYTCKICGKYCGNQKALRKHTNLHEKNKQLVCQLCDKRFIGERMLQSHLKVHTELKYPCEFCQRIYISLYRLKKHIKRSHIPNICSECDKVFYDRAEFTKHKKEHKVGLPVTCTFCSKAFDKAKNLSEHIRLQHKEDGKTNRCDICEKEFINASLLKNHIKTHDKNLKCSQCGKVFSSRYNLETHMVVHTGARNHKCPICGNSFTSKTSLKNHVAIHTDARPFTCDLCSKTFKTNRRLYVHKYSHATEEKYECEICQAKFKVKQYLKYHMKKHSDDKPYECKPCKKWFKHKKSWEKHALHGQSKRISTKDLDFECTLCGECFEEEHYLVEHATLAHDGKNGDSLEYVPIKSEIKSEPWEAFESDN